MRKTLEEELAKELHAQLQAVPATAHQALLEHLARLTEQRVLAERKRCSEVCVRRSELWHSTARKTSPLSLEARARANEAQYLAELIGSGEELTPVSLA